MTKEELLKELQLYEKLLKKALKHSFCKTQAIPGKITVAIGVQQKEKKFRIHLNNIRLEEFVALGLKRIKKYNLCSIRIEDVYLATTKFVALNGTMKFLWKN